MLKKKCYFKFKRQKKKDGEITAYDEFTGYNATYKHTYGIYGMSAILPFAMCAPIIAGVHGIFNWK